MCAGAKVHVHRHIHIHKHPLSRPDLCAIYSYIVESSVYEISVGQYVTDGKMITHRLKVK